MPLPFRTRVVLALGAGLPVVFLVIYPFAFGLLPVRWQEWADLPRDWLVFVASECLVLGLFELVARVRSRREG